MKLNPKEPDELYNFVTWLNYHSGNSYKFVYEDNSVINAVFDTMCESENCLELDDPDYEEYYAIFFYNVETGASFEMNYHCMPKEVWCDGKLVDLSKNYYQEVIKPQKEKNN